MEPADLRRRARQEADELGPEPLDVAERPRWREERWGAAVLLCGLADDDPDLLRRMVDSEVSDPIAKALLYDAIALAGLRDLDPPSD